MSAMDIDSGSSRGRNRNRNRNRNRRRNRPNKEAGDVMQLDSEEVEQTESRPKRQHTNPQAPHQRRVNKPELDSTPATTSGPVRTVAQGGAAAHLSNTTFASLQLCEPLNRAVHEVLNFRNLTDVQEQTLPLIQAGADVLARARTGTGKTMAFLLPSLEKVWHALQKKPRSTAIAPQMLVVSPTRELATQIATEAKALLSFAPHISTQVVFGGTNVKADVSRMQRGLDVLIGTPGRLLDHINNTPGILQALRNLKILVLDEADQLLEMGFRPDIQRIINACAPSEKRQTLLFSATVPKQVHDIKHMALRQDHEFVDTVGSDSANTHDHVKQHLLIVDADKHVSALDNILTHHIRSVKAYKVIVFFPTARVAGFMSQLFTTVGHDVIEMHSRKSQSYRTKASDRFRSGNNLIMFSSDVSARGVDYPGVTLIVQVGLTTREQYIHRLGRTARAGEAGDGILMLCDFESSFKNSLKDLPVDDITAMSAFATATASPALLAALRSVPSRLKKEAGQAYAAFLGYYNGNTSRLKVNKAELVRIANRFSCQIGLKEPPALTRRMVAMCQLKGVPGIRVE